MGNTIIKNNSLLVGDNGEWAHVNSNYVICSKRAGIVTVMGESNGTVTLSAGAWNNIGTLPVGYRPTSTVNFILQNRSAIQPCWGQVQTDGVIRVFGDSSAAFNYWQYSITFPVAN